MGKMPKKPNHWGDDMRDTQASRNGLPDPVAYARLGEFAGELLADPHDPTGEFQASGVMYNLGQLLAFHREGPLDAGAQRHGGSRAKGNYAFGVYNAARGAKLESVLGLANWYGKLFSEYPDDTKMDTVYTSIPAENVQNIIKGYSDHKKGKLRRTP